jgi:WD40 repeat protein
LGVYRGHTRAIPCLVISPDGLSVVSGGFDGMVKIWDLSQTQGPHVLTDDSKKTASSYLSNEGNVLVGDRDGAVHLLDVRSGEKTRTYEGLESFVTRVASTVDGRLIIGIDQSGKLAVWRSNDATMAFSRERCAKDLAMSANGARLAVASRTSSKPSFLLSLNNLEVVGQFEGRPPVSIGQAGGIIGSSVGIGREYKVLDISSGKEMLSVRPQLHGYDAAMISLDNRFLAVSSFERVTAFILIYDLESGELKYELKGHADRVECLAFHPAGNRLATGSGDTTVKIWDLETGIETITLRGHSGEIQDLIFRGDGRQLLSFCSDGEVRVWSAEKTDPGIARPRPFALW